MDQMLGTALLLLIILAVTDEENMKITSSLVPVIIGLGLSAIHLRLVSKLGWTHISKTCPMVATQYSEYSTSSFGLNAGSAINPARDFSPRLLSYLAGWNDAFTVNCFRLFFIMGILKKMLRLVTAGSGCLGSCLILEDW